MILLIIIDFIGYSNFIVIIWNFDGNSTLGRSTYFELLHMRWRMSKIQLIIRHSQTYIVMIPTFDLAHRSDLCMCINAIWSTRVTKVVRVKTNIIYMYIQYDVWRTWRMYTQKKNGEYFTYNVDDIIDIFIYYVPEQNSISLVACAC